MKQTELMVFFVVAVLHSYRAEIVPAETAEDFIKKNESVIGKVRDASLRRFNYHLSYNEIDRGIKEYMAEPLSIMDSAAMAA